MRCGSGWLSYQDDDEASDRDNAQKAGGCGGGIGY